MKLFKILLLMLALTMTACSSKKNSESSDAETTEVSQEDADFIVDADDEDLTIDEVEANEDEALLAEAEESVDEAIASAPVISGGMGQYTVKRNETLMMIAFKIYGDYRKWKELADINQVSSRSLKAGTIIQYNQPTEVFSWNPEGLPYLIKVGDSLGSISDDKYGTPAKWRKIYNNNRPLIRDPNLIFAGFTLYYIPERELASE